jgi:DNA-directed RNA polymerase subunit F
MIKDATPLSMAESTEYFKGKDGGTEISGFVKKFSKLNVKEAKELRKRLKGLDLMKIDEKHTSKIIDVLPENNEELAKVFVGISLDEEESKKVLDLIKEFK